jgi:tetratricopeptide (TPR) repeat protein
MGRFEPPSKRVQVDVRLDEVVLRALEREPARRYQQVGEVKTNVENITATPPPAPVTPPAPKVPTPGPPLTPPRAEKPAAPTKRKTVLAAGSAVMLLIVAFLVWLPHGKAVDQKHFDQLLASAKALLVEKKYDLAIHDLEEARKVQPQDVQVNPLLDQARQQRHFAALEEKYQSAIQDGSAALARGDYQEALAQADEALKLKPVDAPAIQLRQETKTKQGAVIHREAAYKTALKDGREALARDDYAGASALAETALSIKPDDAEARQLRDEARRKLQETTPLPSQPHPPKN